MGFFLFLSFFHYNTIGNILLQYKNILKSSLLEAWFRIIKNILPLCGELHSLERGNILILF